MEGGLVKGISGGRVKGFEQTTQEFVSFLPTFFHLRSCFFAWRRPFEDYDRVETP